MKESKSDKIVRWYIEGWQIMGKSLFTYVMTALPLILIAALL